MSERRNALRRYPALGFLAVAGALALLLPSRLSAPRTEPQSLSEFAPVPGEGSDTGGDLSGLDAGGTSADIGARGVLRPTPTEPQDAGARLRQPPASALRCVGNPPRQTEDPLSPPCVPRFEGSNGGATTRGVSADEIVVVLHWTRNGSSSTGPMEGFVDYAQPISGDERTEDLVGKALSVYFNSRYQLYGRRLHLWGYYGGTYSPSAPTPDQLKAQVAAMDDQRRPFAWFPGYDETGTDVQIPEAASRGFVVASFSGFERAVYKAVAPYLFSYAPEIEDTASNAASYVCRKLAGRRAIHSGNAADTQAVRRFGLMYPDRDGAANARKLAAALRSGIGACEVTPVEAPVRSAQDIPGVVANLRGSGVTTVLWPNGSPDAVTTLNVAAAQAWYPEWVFPSQFGTGGDDTAAAQLYQQDEWSHAFGVSSDFRRRRVDQQYWYRAIQEGCGGCTVPRGSWAPRAYETMSLLLYGIQTAGPRLAPQTLDRGLHSIPERRSDDPYIPATYFRPGNYSWIKDGKQMWWDPREIAPGESRPGCYRLPGGGERFGPGEWPEGDQPFSASDPCQGPAQIF